MPAICFHLSLFLVPTNQFLDGYYTVIATNLRSIDISVLGDSRSQLSCCCADFMMIFVSACTPALVRNCLSSSSVTDSLPSVSTLLKKSLKKKMKVHDQLYFSVNANPGRAGQHQSVILCRSGSRTSKRPRRNRMITAARSAARCGSAALKVTGLSHGPTPRRASRWPRLVWCPSRRLRLRRSAAPTSLQSPDWAAMDGAVTDGQAVKMEKKMSTK